MASKTEEWLRIPVPPSKTPEWDEWLATYRELGDECVPVFFEALQYGTPLQQYSALLGLRWRGFEAWAVGDGHALVYEVRAPGYADVRVIKPAITEPALLPAYPPIPASPRLSAEAHRWIAAGIALGSDALAAVACPRCARGTLNISDVHAKSDPSRFERIMRCPSCGATNVLLMRHKD